MALSHIKASAKYGLGGALRKCALAICFFAAFTTSGAAQPITVVALGDSLVQGYGLQPEQGFVPQLENWLQASGEDAEVQNSGVSGDTTAGGLARIEWTLASEPDALIVVLGGNDLLRGILPEHSRENLEGILAAASDRGLPVLLAGHEAPSNYGPEYRDEFEAIYPELAETYGATLYPKFFAALDAEGDRREVRRKYMQDDGIHPNSDGVALIVASVGPFVVELIQAARAKQ